MGIERDFSVKKYPAPVKKNLLIKIYTINNSFPVNRKRIERTFNNDLFKQFHRFLFEHNALLRCEQRNTNAAAYHLKH